MAATPALSHRRWIDVALAVVIALGFALGGSGPPASAAVGEVTLTGRVMVSNSTTPAGAGEVAVHYTNLPSQYAYQYSPYVLTDAAGNFTIVGDAGTYSLFFQEVGGASIASMYWGGPTVSDITYINATADVSGLNITLPPRAIVSGQISLGSAGGHPGAAAGYMIAVLQGSSYSYTGPTGTTGSDGAFSVALDPGMYQFIFSAPGFQSRYWNGSVTTTAESGFAVGTQNITGVNPILPPYGSISGHVTLGTTGHAAAAGQVKVSFSVGSFVTTNANGDYTIPGLSDGVYNLTFQDIADQDFQTSYVNGVTVSPSVPNPIASPTLRATGSISGVVTLGDDSHPAGAGEVKVSFSGPNSDGSLPPFVASTDGSGHYSITGLAAGTYTLYFHYTGTGAFADEYWSNVFSYSDATKTSVVDAPVNRNVTLPASGSISGRLLNFRHSTDKAYISAYNTADLATAAADVQVESNSDGTFILPRLAPGTYRLRFHDEGFPGIAEQWYGQTAGSPLGQTLVVTAGSSQALGDITLHHGASVTGTVSCVGSCDFQGLNTAVAELDGRDSPTSPWVELRSDYADPGYFSTYAWVPGEYRLTFRGPTDYSCAAVDSDPFTVTDDQPVALALTMRCGGVPPNAIPGGYEALPPSRLLDTRIGVGASGSVAPHTSLVLQVTGRGGVPASGVSAVVLNVTLAASTAPGFVTAYPHGSTLPTASNLNFVAGQVVPNLVVVPVGADGKVDLYNGSTAPIHLVADVSGYYVSGSPTDPGAFGALPPSRLLDTRIGVGASGSVAPHTSLVLQVTGRGGVPASGVSAVVLNVTLAASTAPGFVTAYPHGSTLPTASNLNFVAGQVVPNLVVVPVGADGKVDLYNGSTAPIHLVADVSGYYVSGSPTDPGAFGALPPSRLLDTRIGVGASGSVAPHTSLVLQVTGRGGVPASGVSAVVLNVTLAASTAPGFVTAYPHGSTLPTASNLNFVAGQVVPNLVVVPVGADGKVDLYNGSTAPIHLVADVSGYYVSAAP